MWEKQRPAPIFLWGFRSMLVPKVWRHPPAPPPQVADFSASSRAAGVPWRPYKGFCTNVKCRAGVRAAHTAGSKVHHSAQAVIAHPGGNPTPSPPQPFAHRLLGVCCIHAGRQHAGHALRFGLAQQAAGPPLEGSSAAMPIPQHADTPACLMPTRSVAEGRSRGMGEKFILVGKV